MRRIAIVTVGRSDFGLYLPLLHELRKARDFELSIIAGGMHLAPEFGSTAEEIERAGFTVDESVEMLVSSDTPVAISKSMGLGTIGFAEAFRRTDPDLVVVLGDRFEMHAAAVAAQPFLVPVAHIAGGAVTLGAIDDSFRHSMTKLAHLHFTETELHTARLVRMGEEPWRVTTVGALALDNVRTLQLLSREALSAQLSLDLDDPPLLVTFHPVTREFERTEEHIAAVLEAVDRSGRQAVFTYPNADTSGRVIIREIEQFARTRPRVRVERNLGTVAYLSLMSHAAAMVGNSSSGIVEAASFELPVVDVGIRQAGRLAPQNVVRAAARSDEIAAAIDRATSAEFRTGLRGMRNPYGDGHAAARIVEAIAKIGDRQRLVRKMFHE